MAFGVNDRLEDFRDLCATRGACQEALDWLDGYISRRQPLKEMVANIRANTDGAEWAYWARTEIADQLTAAAKLAFTDMATLGRPSLALAFDLFRADLTQAEADLVRTRWSADEYPRIAQELNSGIVKRARR